MAITAPVNRGTGTSTTNNTTVAVASAGACTAGNLLIFIAGGNVAASLSSVSGGGATWAVAQTTALSTTSFIGLAWCIVPVGGIADTTSITGTMNASTTRKVAAMFEFGLDGGWTWPSTPTDKGTTNTGTDSAKFNSGTTAATTQADELIVVACANNGNTTAFTAGTGYTVAPFTSNTGIAVVSAGSTPRSIVAEYKTVSATGTQQDNTNAWTTGTGAYAAALETFAPTVAAGSTYTKAGSGAFGSAG